MTFTPSEAPLRHVLYEFSLAKSFPDEELLADFVQRFPQYANSLRNSPLSSLWMLSIPNPRLTRRRLLISTVRVQLSRGQ